MHRYINLKQTTIINLVFKNRVETTTTNNCTTRVNDTLAIIHDPLYEYINSFDLCVNSHNLNLDIIIGKLPIIFFIFVYLIVLIPWANYKLQNIIY